MEVRICNLLAILLYPSFPFSDCRMCGKSKNFRLEAGSRFVFAVKHHEKQTK